MLKNIVGGLIAAIALLSPILTNVFGIISHDNYAKGETYLVPGIIAIMPIFSVMIGIIVMMASAISLKFVPYGLSVLISVIFVLYSATAVAGKYFNTKKINERDVSVADMDKPVMIAGIVVYIMALGLAVKYAK